MNVFLTLTKRIALIAGAGLVLAVCTNLLVRFFWFVWCIDGTILLTIAAYWLGGGLLICLVIGGIAHDPN